MESIQKNNEKVNRALASGALALGAEVISEDRPDHSPLINDTALCKLMADVAEEILGKDSVKRTTTWGYGTTDMGDLTCVMRACHPYISGAVGHGHGDDYFITDPECSCVISADIYMMTVRALLENGAEKATAIMNGPELRYPNKEAFFAEIDKLMADRDMVKYTDNGAEICFV